MSFRQFILKSSFKIIFFGPFDPVFS